jgi:uncharacterized protein involved in response to NO
MVRTFGLGAFRGSRLCVSCSRGCGCGARNHCRAELAKSQNTRSGIVPAVANIGFHAEAYAFGIAEFSTRATIAAIVILIMLVGGRIVPSFTRNWLSRENPGRLPVPFGRFDATAIACSAAALSLWAFLPVGGWTGAALLLAAGLQCVRLARWSDDRTPRERLVLILHVAYAFVPLMSRHWPGSSHLAGLPRFMARSVP